MSMSKSIRGIQTFNSGVLKVFSVDPQDNGSDKLTTKHGHIRYEERTVGIERYYKAKQDNVEITKVIRIPRLHNVSTQDIVMLENGEQYKIHRLAYPKDVVPLCWDLSLERVTHDYDIKPVKGTSKRSNA